MNQATGIPAYKDFYGTVRLYLRHRGRGLRSAEIEDITQVVMEKILRAYAKGKGPTWNARAWVRRIAHNEYVNWVQKKVRRREHSVAEVYEVEPRMQSSAYTGDLFLREIDTPLSERQQKIVRMISTGRTVRESAKLLGVSPSLVALEIKRIRSELGAMYGDRVAARGQAQSFRRAS